MLILLLTNIWNRVTEWRTRRTDLYVNLDKVSSLQDT